MSAATQPLPALDARRARLRAIIQQKSLLVAGNEPFVLASGRTSRYLIDLKPSVFDPEGANLIGALLYEKLARAEIDVVGGMESGGIPLVALVVQHSVTAQGLPGFFVRKQSKDHGAKKRIEGVLPPLARVALVEDVTTTGGSVMQAVDAVREAGGRVVQIVTVVDRLEGARDNLEAHGIRLDAILTRADFGL
ncbi:MAG: orotate phosphoribosyltransferase [Alphaproteobacteria bacterium]